jgi:Flp pilus assembly protein TadD
MIFQKRIALLAGLAALLLLPACEPQLERELSGDPVDSLLGKRAATQRHMTEAAADAVAAGKTAEARDLYAELYKIPSRRAEVALTYAQLLRRTGDPGKAAMVLTPVVLDRSGEIMPDAHPLAVTELAAAHVALGNFDTAERLLNHVIQDPAAAPYEADAVSLLGIVFDNRGQHAEAERLYRRALASWRGDASPVVNNLGLCLAAQGRYDEGLDVLRKALVVSSNDKQEIARNIALLSDLRATRLAKAPVVVKKKASVVKKKRAACPPCPIPQPAEPVLK